MDSGGYRSGGCGLAMVVVFFFFLFFLFGDWNMKKTDRFIKKKKKKQRERERETVREG